MAKQVHLRTSLPIDAVLVQADRLKILRVCNNLISNAIKYTAPSTEVCVTVSTCNGDVLLQVSDQGPGIGEEDRNLLFDRFSRLARDKRTRDEGTGLGLAVTKELVLLHQGQITVESELGKGSTFCVQFPRYQLSGPEGGSPRRPGENALVPVEGRTSPDHSARRP
jgi:signal transduction histidine kinase